MAKHVELNDVSKPALMRAAQAAVAAALAGDFPVDPIVGPELSRALSTVGSVVKRHGGLIEMGIAGALLASDRFIVLTNVALPLTKGAIQLLDAKNTDENLARIRLSADSEAEGIVNVDLVVVDPEAGWAGAYEIKRGNGVTEHGKRRPIVRKLKAARLVLASYVKQAGYGPVETVTSAVIDYFGGSGFEADFTLTREQLDLHFGVPVAATVDAMTDTVRETLRSELPRLLGPVVADMLPAKAPTRTRSKTKPAAGLMPPDNAVLHTLNAPPTGPGQPRTQYSAVSEPTHRAQAA
ncbi:hypothetical protein MXD81_29520 [Microbacteriaceae bacterium K1510]|nr:hypothetical protein [Microbacteriaceae bacterium K1510]